MVEVPVRPLGFRFSSSLALSAGGFLSWLFRWVKKCLVCCPGLKFSSDDMVLGVGVFCSFALTGGWGVEVL